MDDEKLEQVINQLLSCLPDSDHNDPCWEWCWDELNDEAQQQVKEARRMALNYLHEIANVGESGD